MLKLLSSTAMSPFSSTYENVQQTHFRYPARKADSIKNSFHREYIPSNSSAADSSARLSPFSIYYYCTLNPSNSSTGYRPVIAIGYPKSSRSGCEASSALLACEPASSRGQSPDFKCDPAEGGCSDWAVTGSLRHLVRLRALM